MIPYFSQICDALLNAESLCKLSSLNTHCKGLHSLIIKPESPMIRLYYASKEHELWRNIYNIKPSEIDCRHFFHFPYEMSIAIHTHRQDITILPLGGWLYNEIFEKTLFDNHHGGYFNLELNSFKYQSPLIESQGFFSREKNSVVLRRLPGIYSLEKYKAINMAANQLRTITVPQNCSSAWIIIEGNSDPNYDSTCYSNSDLTQFDFSSYYQEMNKEQYISILKSIGDVA